MLDISCLKHSKFLPVSKLLTLQTWRDSSAHFRCKKRARIASSLRVKNLLPYTASYYSKVQIEQGYIDVRVNNKSYAVEM